MFTRDEIKEFLIKFGKRWLFPDFYNKVTWAVVTLGSAVILAPTPLKLVFYNWLIDSFNLNAGDRLTFAQIGQSSADYWLGFALIIAALLHNIFSKWLLHQDSLAARVDSQKIDEVDRMLFKDFLNVFPSGSRSAHLLETHDFGNSFNLDSLRDIDVFVNEWNRPERSFINPDLESMRAELWKKCHEFSWLIAKKSAPTYGGFQSVVPDRHKDDWDWPEWVDDDVKAVNALATDVFKMHQNFIAAMRLALKC